MNFDSFSDFLHMGGYASYVWSAFSITFAAMLFLSVRRSKKLMQAVERKLARQARIEAAKKMENTL